MATKTKAIEVKVDEQLAETLKNKAVKAWHATDYSNGRRRLLPPAGGIATPY